MVTPQEIHDHDISGCLELLSRYNLLSLVQITFGTMDLQTIP